MTQNGVIFTTAQIVQSSVGKRVPKGGHVKSGSRAHIPLQTLTSFLTEWLRNNYSSRRKRPMRASVIAIDFSPACTCRILKECNKLVKSLRMRLGNAFLQGVHTVCAHPVKTNLFVKTNRYNHLPNMFGR